MCTRWKSPFKQLGSRTFNYLFTRIFHLWSLSDNASAIWIRPESSMCLILVELVHSLPWWIFSLPWWVLSPTPTQMGTCKWSMLEDRSTHSNRPGKTHYRIQIVNISCLYETKINPDFGIYQSLYRYIAQVYSWACWVGTRGHYIWRSDPPKVLTKRRIRQAVRVRNGSCKIRPRRIQTSLALSWALPTSSRLDSWSRQLQLRCSISLPFGFGDKSTW